MKKRIIEFKTAQLAKEKGFLKDCFYHYDKNGEIQENQVSHKTYVATHHLYANSYDFEIERWGGGNKDCIAAPTQAQLQTWLRNKKILVEVRPIDDWNHWCYSIFMEDCMLPFFEVKNNNEYPSYEEALEAGLYEGLTNIK